MNPRHLIIMIHDEASKLIQNFVLNVSNCSWNLYCIEIENLRSEFQKKDSRILLYHKENKTGKEFSCRYFLHCEHWTLATFCKDFWQTRWKMVCNFIKSKSIRNYFEKRVQHVTNSFCRSSTTKSPSWLKTNGIIIMQHAKDQMCKLPLSVEINHSLDKVCSNDIPGLIQKFHTLESSGI